MSRLDTLKSSRSNQTDEDQEKELEEQKKGQETGRLRIKNCGRGSAKN